MCEDQAWTQMMPIQNRQDATQGEFESWFEFRTFLLLDRLPYKSFLFTHNCTCSINTQVHKWTFGRTCVKFIVNCFGTQRVNTFFIFKLLVGNFVDHHLKKNNIYIYIYIYIYKKVYALCHLESKFQSVRCCLTTEDNIMRVEV